MPPRPALVDPRLGPLTDDLLTPEVRVFQRLGGHRFSSDDVATAYCAHRAAPDARNAIDLGCGLGSVLLLLAWRLEHARLVGVEAQEGSFELLRRNVERNASVRAIGARVAVRRGDLREVALEPAWQRAFDLVSGTPPYFPPGAAIDSPDSQRAHARVEHRGGVEAYVEAGARLIADDGVLVLCGDARADGRVREAAAQCALELTERTDAIPRESKPALFSVWTLRRHREGRERTVELVLRDASGAPGPGAAALRAFSGFGPAR
jgi:tRNA1Val (adenine37-N6)-methyltransferase